jgi:SWI/SNF-related matrix-associated actin-dependent regulator of chromatin subfamily A protein 2/4
LLRERENRIQQKVVYRIEELENLPATMSEDVRLKVIIELKALRLLNFQKQVRKD